MYAWPSFLVAYQLGWRQTLLGDSCPSEYGGQELGRKDYQGGVDREMFRSHQEEKNKQSD